VKPGKFQDFKIFDPLPRFTSESFPRIAPPSKNRTGSVPITLFGKTMSSENEKAEAKKEIIRQESFWFTATTLAFVGFAATTLKSPTRTEASIAIALIAVIAAFTVFLLVGRHRAYRKLNFEDVSWCGAFGKAVIELSGTLYCVGIVIFAAIGFSAILWARFIATTP
jgi:hypothetical protein